MAKHTDSVGPQGPCFCRCPHSQAPLRSTKSTHSTPRPQGQNSAPTTLLCCPWRWQGQCVHAMPRTAGKITLPCQERRKLWEDLTRCNVTCQDPTWTFFLSINSSFGSSQKSRQVPEEALCGWPEGGYLLSSSDLYFSLVFLGGKKCWRCPTSSTCH